MGYQTGTSTGPNDLIDKLRLFLIAEGWSVNGWTTAGLGYRLHVQKSAASGGPEMFFNFRSAVAETGSTVIQNNNGGTAGTISGLIVNGSTGYNGASDWDKQPGYSQNPYDNNYAWGGCMTPMSLSAIPAYYFFTVENTVNICVEIVAGKFQFMSFGCLEKQGTYDGGMFWSASLQTDDPNADYTGPSNVYEPKYFTYNVSGTGSGAVWFDADGTAGWRTADSTDELAIFPVVAGQTGNASYSQVAFDSFFWEKSPNFYNNIAAMAPIYVFGKRSDDNYSLLGWPAGVRTLNFTNYTAGQEVTYGSETWKIFEADSLGVDVLNENIAFAFLKET